MQNLKVAAVAGGSAGVGRAVVQKLLGRGYAEGIPARGEARLEVLQSDLGERALCMPCDVPRAEAVQEATMHITHQLGPLSVWVNWAMLTVFSLFAQVTAEGFEKIVATDVLSARDS